MATPVSNKPARWEALLTEVHAWQLRPSELCDPESRNRWLRLLPVEERTHYEQLGTDQTRSGYLGALVLCRTTLSRYTGRDPADWRFRKGAFGKPKLAGPADLKSLSFNVTHTDDLVICAVTRAGDVGIDTEDTSRPVDAALVARHFFSHDGQKRLAAVPPRERTASFFEQWVLREAYVKATGRGLGTTPERLTIERGGDGAPLAMGSCEFSLYRPTPRHVAAAAVIVRDPARRISFEWLSAERADLLPIRG